MRTEKEFEEERYYGLQRFDNPEEAFDVMCGYWGENAGESETELQILTDESFPKVIFRRALQRMCDYKMGEISWEDCSKALGLSQTVSDYLLDFDFFLNSSKSGRYYTCRMSFKDDYVYMWNKRQWEYYEELSELYSFKEIAENAKEIVGKYEGTDYDSLLDEVDLW
jgi:hypothetical protein